MSIKSFRPKRGTHGFTLLELIVVIVILGILAALTIPTFKKVIATSELKSAEATTASLVRETLALSAFDANQIISEEHLQTAARDLTSRAVNPGEYAAASSNYQVVFGRWEFSGNAKTVSAVRGGDPLGSSVGVALSVPGVGCAFSRSEGSSVKSWSVLDVAPANCNGAGAYIDPENLSNLNNPPSPAGLEVEHGCVLPDGSKGWDITFDQGLADVFINGTYVGRHASGACLPGKASDDVVVITASGSQPGWPGGIGDVLDDGSIELPGESEEAVNVSMSVHSDGIIPTLVEWTSNDKSMTVSRQLTSESTWTVVYVGTESYIYDTPKAGDYIYKAHPTTGGQSVSISALKVSAPPTVTSDGGSGDKPAIAVQGKTALISWGAVESDKSAPVNGYNVYRSVRGGAYGLIGTTTSTNLSNGSLTLGEYCYRVSSYGPGGESARSTASCATLNAVWGERTAQRSKVVASDPSTDAQFGSTVSIDGNVMVVGAHKDQAKGAAYVYVYNGSTWVEQAKLTASNGAEGDGFGFSVAASGDTVVVGAPYSDQKGLDAGSAYVFTRSGSVWTQQAELVAKDGASIDYLGISVSIDQNTIVTGAYYDDDKGADSGSAYVFSRNGSSWTQQAKLRASDGAAGDFFAYSVTVEANTIVAGAHWADTNGLDSGSAYVFTRSGSTWTEQAKLLPHDGAEQDYFGYSVSLSGDTVVIGAHWEDAKGNNSGSAYVFTRTAGTWTEQTKLFASDGAAHDVFGNSVSISGETIVIGAYQDDDKGMNSGSAYIFTRAAGTWSQKPKLLVTDGSSNDYFGYSVSIDGDNIAVGAYQDDDGGTDSGSAYIFRP